ncbi:MAG: GAF domain-containing protein [Lachnospiraceae bacterium]|nr:GAF domain-containing protein [Lachnospiraceae bacterium]
MRELSNDRLIQIAIELSAQKDIDLVLDHIIGEAMDLTGCDGGTVYSLEDGFLHFHNVVTRSKDFHMSKSQGNITLPPVSLEAGNICAICAREKRRINVPDVYESTEFDFSGPKKYDALNNYRTTSLLVLPMEDDKGNVIGVLQLLNAMDSDGNVIPFSEEYERTIYALSSLAAVSMNNRRLAQEVYDILHSFVQVMASAIDMRSPYNANHTRSMVRYGKRFIRWLNASDSEWKFPEDTIDPFLMSVWLHDVGKLVIPLEVMDKADRLGVNVTGLMHKLEIAVLMQRIRGLEHPEEREAAEEEIRYIESSRDLILSKNSAGFLPDDVMAQIRAMGEHSVLDSEGNPVPMLNETELHCMLIQKGTLTDEERQIMQSHVVRTSEMLSRMKFSGSYMKVPEWAGGHHELLDGSGYPKHMTAEQLPKEVRLLTIIDIYDALTAEDRPYKPPMPCEKALGILHSMVEEGKLDGEILDLFEKSGAWKKDHAADRDNE